ncbi:MAG: ABC transporter substrate-binding protein [Gammaproteobacteria bacterium]
MNVIRGSLTAFFVVMVLASPVTQANGEPCCIILVPSAPPPPAPEEKGPDPTPSFGPIYAQLPVLAAVEKKLFIRVDVGIQVRESQRAIQEVSATTGTLGIAPISDIAAFNARPGAAKVLVVGVIVNRSTYGLFSSPTGAASIAELKGKNIAVPGFEPVGRLYLAQVLRGAGLAEKDVKIVVWDRTAFNPSTVSTAFARGNIAATLAFDGFKWDPSAKVTRLTGPAAVVTPLWVLYSGLVTLSTETTHVARLINGINAGLRAVKGESKLARNLLREFKVSSAAAQAIEQYVPLVLPDTIRPNVAQIRQTGVLMKEIGLISEIAPLTDEQTLRTVYELAGR